MNVYNFIWWKNLQNQCHYIFYRFSMEFVLCHDFPSFSLRRDFSGDLARFGHSALLYKGSMYIYGGFNGQTKSDILLFSAGSCSHVKVIRKSVGWRCDFLFFCVIMFWNQTIKPKQVLFSSAKNWALKFKNEL